MNSYSYAIAESTGKKDIPSQKLQNMLRYLVDSREENAKDEDLKRLSQMLKNVKANKRVGEQYMHTWMREQHIREEAKQEGMEETTKDIIKNMYRNGFSLTQIMTATNVTKEFIARIVAQETDEL